MTGALPVGRARTIFIGTGGFGVPALRALAGAGPEVPIDLVGVVTTPGRPAGRRGEQLASPVEAAARELALQPVLAVPSLRPAEAVAAVLALDPVLVVLADDGRIVPRALLAVRHGALNLHPSLLPRHRGATPVPATILAGDSETGVTIIRMDEGIDSGPIVATERTMVAERETAPQLEERLAGIAARLLLRTIGPWLAGWITAQPQAIAGVTMTRQLRREDGRLDPSRQGTALERQIRALQPWPGTFVETGLGRLVVHAAVVAPLQSGDLPGDLVAHGRGFALVAADGRLVIESATLAGGRRMSAEELRRGHPQLVGGRVVLPDGRPGG